jgi:hypothetical protein
VNCAQKDIKTNDLQFIFKKSELFNRIIPRVVDKPCGSSIKNKKKEKTNMKILTKK